MFVPIPNEPSLLWVLGGIIVVLVLLLLVVTVILLQALRKQSQKVEKKGEFSKVLPALPKGPDSIAAEPGDVDVTRMTPFALVPPDALPRLSGDEEREDEDDEVANADESKALLHFEGNSWLGVDEPTGPVELILTAAAGQTDRGVTRRRNEDAYLLDPSLDLYIVADGMGGYAGGQVASSLAVEEVHAAIHAGRPVPDYPDRPRRGREIIAAVERANAVVYAESRKDKSLTGMGTTLLVVRFSLRKQRVYIGHVGDSRCYRLRAGELKLLTSDHTLAARGVTGPLASNIRRAIGVAPRVKVDLVIDKPWPEDLYLLCSDGLNKMVRDDHIHRILSQDEDLNRTVGALVLAANASGGRDNITVVLVRVREVTLGRGWRAGGDVSRARA
jgi:serine/threonine protein phosphatase PrpC